MIREITPEHTYQLVGTNRKLKMAEILAEELQNTAIANLTILNQKVSNDIVLSSALGVTPTINRILIQPVNCKCIFIFNLFFAI